jgi:ferredoxin
MAIMITDECINCGACEPECPNNAIYEGGAEWRLADGTSLKGMQTTPMGTTYDAEAANTPKTMDVYYIVTDKCTECTGFHDEPQCAAVCPVDCCVDDPDHPRDQGTADGEEGIHAPLTRCWHTGDGPCVALHPWSWVFDPSTSGERWPWALEAPKVRTSIASRRASVSTSAPFPPGYDLRQDSLVLIKDSTCAVVGACRCRDRSVG